MPSASGAAGVAHISCWFGNQKRADGILRRRWTSICQRFWCSVGSQVFYHVLPYGAEDITHNVVGYIGVAHSWRFTWNFPTPALLEESMGWTTAKEAWSFQRWFYQNCLGSIRYKDPACCASWRLMDVDGHLMNEGENDAEQPTSGACHCEPGRHSWTACPPNVTSYAKSPHRMRSGWKSFGCSPHLSIYM